MKPIYPNFKPITLEDQALFYTYLKDYPSYSDFNFVSLFSWNAQGKNEFCFLHDNLVIKLESYEDSSFFLSLIGQRNLLETVQELFEYARNHNLDQSLHMVPDITVRRLKRYRSFFQDIIIQEDRDNFDYIYDPETILKLDGSKLKDKRYKVNKYKNNYGENTSIQSAEYIHTELMNDCLQLFDYWEKSRQQTPEDTQYEKDAHKRIFKNSETLPVHFYTCSFNDELIGYSICEILPGNVGMIHQEKTTLEHPGDADYFMYKIVEDLAERNCTAINYQQDLGIKGLRQAKKKWNPQTLLKKYTLTPRHLTSNRVPDTLFLAVE